MRSDCEVDSRGGEMKRGCILMFDTSPCFLPGVPVVVFCCLLLRNSPLPSFLLDSIGEDDFVGVGRELVEFPDSAIE